MARTKILALIMAGGAGSRMQVLTDVRAKPALPFAGLYRLIDFPLSNCMHSGISDVWVVEQFLPHALNEHLANGRPWDLDRTYGGLRLIPPYTGAHESGWHQGNADALYRNLELIRAWDPTLLLVLSADHVYKLDYNQVVDAHMARNAEVTMVTTRVPLDQASRFGTVQVDDQGRVTDFAYKPEAPRSDIVTTEVFVYTTATLLEILGELAAEQGDSGKEGGPNLQDFGNTLLPRLVQRGRAYAHPLDGYWRDVGTIESYWQAHMDLLAAPPPLELDEPNWPIHTYGVQLVPARIAGTARIANSLIAPGCKIRGQVVDSVLAPGVVVEAGAVVRNAILFHDTLVEARATVEYAILDSGARVREAAHVGGRDAQAAGAAEAHAPTKITLVGQQAEVAPGVRVTAGQVIQPKPA